MKVYIVKYLWGVAHSYWLRHDVTTPPVLLLIPNYCCISPSNWGQLPPSQEWNGHVRGLSSSFCADFDAETRIFRVEPLKHWSIEVSARQRGRFASWQLWILRAPVVILCWATWRNGETVNGHSLTAEWSMVFFSPIPTPRFKAT